MKKITCASVRFNKEESRYLAKTMSPFWLSSGKWVREFESGIRNFIGSKYCIACNSGSSANLLAITALTSPLLGSRRVKPGDEVITTALCFPTTVAPIIQNRLIPVFVDVNNNLSMDIDALIQAITPKTKVIVVAHTLGIPADMGAIMEIALERGIWVIEDNCDSLGARASGKYTGTIGDIGTMSFYPAHHITTGEGGMVLTNNHLLSRAIKSFRDWGRDCICETGHDNYCGKRHSLQFGRLPMGYDHKYVFTHIGYNLKMTDLQASIGCAQMLKLDSFIKARRKNWESITGEKLIPGVSPFGVLYHTDNRIDIVPMLEKNGVQTRMVFAGNITKQPMMDEVDYRISGKLTNTDDIMNNVFWVGCHPNLTKQQINKMRILLDESKSKCIIPV
jgi:CDP-6-deoxy-D-xylo-4-hexulose-3-dehydrase